ncbi:MAG: PEGA domain-containing protein, partial [Polyangiaceae bacterium]|nr:PEGA domain-containing protein [Polyangiaceae bacterium]
PQIGQAAAQGPMPEQLQAAEPNANAKAEADSMGGLSRATPVSSGEMDSLCELLASEDAPASVRGAMKLSNVGPTQMEPAQVEATKAIAPALKGVGTLEVEGSAALPGSHAGAPNAASGMLSFPSRKRVVRLLSGLGASVALLMATIVVPRFTEPSSSHATSFGAPARAEPTTIPVTSPRVPVAAPALVAAPSVVASPETQHAEVAPASPSVAKNISKTSRLVVAKVKGRRVFVDGRLIGEAPLSIELACGAHEVRIGSKGAKDLLEFPCGETVER